MKVVVKPKDGLRVKDPATRRDLPAAGAEVELDTYWRRRLSDGDVVEVKPAAPARAESARAEAPKRAKGDA